MFLSKKHLSLSVYIGGFIFFYKSNLSDYLLNKEKIMTKEMWINLPVKNVNKSKEFFSQIGLSLNEKHTSGEMVCFEVGEKK